MQVIAIEALAIVLLWFGFSGLNRNNSFWGGIAWAIVGGISFWAVTSISAYLFDGLLTHFLQASIALNGIYVLSMIIGISIGLGCCFLIYKITPLGRTA